MFFQSCFSFGTGFLPLLLTYLFVQVLQNLWIDWVLTRIGRGAVRNKTLG